LLIALVDLAFLDQAQRAATGTIHLTNAFS
jgi:hypothetical protein